MTDHSQLMYSMAQLLILTVGSGLRASCSGYAALY